MPGHAHVEGHLQRRDDSRHAPNRPETARTTSAGVCKERRHGRETQAPRHKRKPPDQHATRTIGT